MMSHASVITTRFSQILLITEGDNIEGISLRSTSRDVAYFIWQSLENRVMQMG